MPKTGRPTKYTPELGEEIAEEIAIGVPITVAYPSRGLHRKCHEAWSKKSEFAFKIAQKRADVVRRCLQRVSEGPWQAAAWWLERTYPEEFGQKPKPLVNVQNVLAQSNKPVVDDATLKYDLSPLPGAPRWSASSR